MVGLVETMPMTVNGLQLTAYGPDEDGIQIDKDLPKDKTPHGEFRDVSRIPSAHLTRPSASSRILPCSDQGRP
jgi:hypothetical protein